jgi:uncharacterized protein
LKQQIKTFLAGGLLALTLFGTAMAGPLEDGWAAYHKGDYAVALSHWRPLAEQGNAAAQSNIGKMYVKGDGVPQEYAQALIWLHKGANQGNANAQGTLGWMYANGQGVPQDYVRAHMWLNLAVSQLDDATRQMPVKERGGMRQGAVKERDDVAAKMTPAQIADAQRLAREWKRSGLVGDAEGSVKAPSVSAILEPPMDARGEECCTHGQRRRNVQGPSNNQWSTYAQIRRG